MLKADDYCFFVGSTQFIKVVTIFVILDPCSDKDTNKRGWLIHGKA